MPDKLLLNAKNHTPSVRAAVLNAYMLPAAQSSMCSGGPDLVDHDRPQTKKAVHRRLTIASLQSGASGSAAPGKQADGGKIALAGK